MRVKVIGVQLRLGLDLGKVSQLFFATNAMS